MCRAVIPDSSPPSCFTVCMLKTTVCSGARISSGDKSDEKNSFVFSASSFSVFWISSSKSSRISASFSASFWIFRSLEFIYFIEFLKTCLTCWSKSLISWNVEGWIFSLYSFTRVWVREHFFVSFWAKRRIFRASFSEYFLQQFPARIISKKKTFFLRQN